MKKNYSTLGAMIMVWLLCACGTEEIFGAFFIPEEEIEILQKDYIQFIFQATEENSLFEFNIRTSNKGQIWINWGEESSWDIYTGNEVLHQYPPLAQEYLITMHAPSITGIRLEGKGCNQLKSLFFGECPDLKEFFLDDKDNQIKDLDLRNCPHLNYEMTFQVCNPDFDFNGLKNCKIIYYYLQCDLPVVLDGYSSTHLHIYPEVDSISEIRISNASQLKNVYIQNSSKPDDKIVYVEKLEFEEININSLGVSNITIGNILSLTQLPSLKYLWLENFDCPETIYLSPSLKGFAYRNPYSGFENRLTYLDLNICRELETLYLWGIKGLTDLNLQSLQNLKQVTIIDSGLVQDYDFIGG